MPRDNSSPTLDATAWVDAAYAAFQTGGLDAVRVEAVARTLGTTKGSFYWHFAGRQDLVDAVLGRWTEETEQIIAATVDPKASPRDRLTALFGAVARRRAPHTGEMLLYGQVDSAGVRAAVEHVTGLRITTVESLLLEVGHDPVEAHARAVLSLATVLGHQQLHHATPQVHGSPSMQRRMLTIALEMVLAEPAD